MNVSPFSFPRIDIDPPRAFEPRLAVKASITEFAAGDRETIKYKALVTVSSIIYLIKDTPDARDGV